MRKNDIRGGTREWSKNLWDHIKALFSGLDTRVTALEQGGGGGGGAVSGVKGDAESSYRTGNVNLTPENLGVMIGATTTIAAGTSTQSLSGLTANHRVLRWNFSGNYADNIPPADITISTSANSYTITVSNVITSGITMTPVFFVP